MFLRAWAGGQLRQEALQHGVRDLTRRVLAAEIGRVYTVTQRLKTGRVQCTSQRQLAEELEQRRHRQMRCNRIRDTCSHTHPYNTA
jgi:hypothetical protein